MSGLVNYRGFSLSETPNLASRVAVVTGGQAGIGKEITAQLLKHGAERVYVLARSKVKFDNAQGFWTQAHGLAMEDLESRVEFVECDLSDMWSVKKVADGLMGRLERLDILILNAGLPPAADYTLSPQGIETIFATNVVGHLELTEILLPKLEETASKYGDSRIVSTSSSFHMACQELNFDLTMSPTRVKSPAVLDSCWRYGRSKLGNVLFTRELSHRLSQRGSENVYANCFFPGNIATEAMDVWSDLLGSIVGMAMKGFFGIVGQSLEDGAATAIYLACSGKVREKDQKGKYFIPIATEDKTSKIAEDKDLAKNLFYWCSDKLEKELGADWAISPSEKEHA